MVRNAFTDLDSVTGAREWLEKHLGPLDNIRNFYNRLITPTPPSKVKDPIKESGQRPPPAMPKQCWEYRRPPGQG